MAATYTVLPDGSGDYATIQDAIDAAVNGDVIELADGTFTGTGNRSISYGGKSITVQSASGDPTACIIDCQGNPISIRGFEFDSNEGRSAVLRNITVTGGYGTGAGLLISSAPTIEGCHIVFNQGTSGAGIYLVGPSADPLIQDCIIAYNTGLGIFVSHNSNPEIRDCIIARNTSGGLQGRDCEMTLDGVTIAYNSGGFGVSFSELNTWDTITITHTIIASNDGPELGYDGSGDAPVIDCTDIWDDGGETWPQDLFGHSSINGNMSADPLFCDPASGNYGLRILSPCGPDETDCGLIGALPVGCSTEFNEYIVHADGSGDFVTVQDAINGASDGDVIYLSDGIYMGDGNRDIDFNGKELKITSFWGNPDACIIDCEGTSGDNHRGFRFDSGEGPAAVLEGLTIRNGHTWWAAGVMCDNGSSPTIRGCVFRDNVAESTGGGLSAHNESAPTILYCRFLNNVAAQAGGAVRCFNGHPALTNCLFAGNTSEFDAGALAANGGSHPQIDSCTFYGNTGATAAGLGLTGSSTADVTNSIIASSTSDPVVDCDGDSTITLTCCDVYGNAGGDYTDCIAGLEGLDGNISVDPQFHDPTGEDFTLEFGSPCSAAVSPCGLIGAFAAAAHPTFHVDADGSGDYPTIQAAIDAAPAGSTILLGDGTFTGDGNRDIMYNGKALTVESANGDPATCIIDCQASAGDQHRGFVFDRYDGTDAVLRGVAVTGAYYEGSSHQHSGGGIHVSVGGATIENCHLFGNYGEQGGGININQANVIVRNCLVTDNDAHTGGGIYVVGGNASCTLDGVTITSNSTVSGGNLHYWLNSNDLMYIYNTIVAMNEGTEVDCYTGDAIPIVLCSDFWDSDGDDWPQSLGSQSYINGNISADPLFCDPDNGDYTITVRSPCRPGINECGLIGACPVGCDPYPHFYYLNADGSGDFPTIQAAIDASTNGDTIWLRDGVFCGDGNRDIDFLGKSITVRSQDGPGSCIIDCQADAGDPHRGFIFQSGETTNSRLEYLTIRNAYAEEGAGILCDNGSRPWIAYCYFYDNRAATTGGGLCSRNGSNTNIRSCFFKGNHAGAGGGAISSNASSPTTYGSSFIGNTSDSGAGAIAVAGDADPHVESCTLVHNIGLPASGVHLTGGSHCTIVKTIIAFGQSGSAVHCEGTSTVTLDCCDVYDNAGGDYVGCLQDVEGVDGNISADPLFCSPGTDRLSISFQSPCNSSPSGCDVIGRSYISCGIIHDVEADGSGDYPTIQAAIDAANDDLYLPDVILLGDGVYMGDGNRELDYIGKDIQVSSRSGDPSACIIDCGADVDNQHRGIVFQNNETDDAVLEGITIRNAYSHHAAGIFCENGASPTIRRCAFRDNTAVSTGGGLSAHNGSAPTIEDCEFYDNHSGNGGGALRLYISSPTIDGCTFAGNTSGTGAGAIAADNGSEPEISLCTLYGNGGPVAGGVAITSSSTATIDRTLIASGTQGPAIACSGGGQTVLSCTDIWGNAGGDWVDCIAVYAGSDGNMSTDPSLCDPDNGDFHLEADSPLSICLTTCGQIGAWLGKCGTVTDITPVPLTRSFLAQNRPNPFNPQTEIHFGLARGGAVTLKIYDLAGRLVRTLADADEFSAGRHNLVWRGEDNSGRRVSSSVYFYKLTTADFVATKKMLILK